MNMQHNLVMSKIEYPGGLRIIECEECRYAFAAEVDQYGALQFNTKVPINQGDIAAAHQFFMTPDIELEFSVGAEAKPANQPTLDD